MPDARECARARAPACSQLGGALDLAAKFGRLTRIFRLIKLANHLSSARLLRMMMLTIGLTFWTHWVACGWWALGVSLPAPAPPSGTPGGTPSGGGASLVDDPGHGGDGVSWVYRAGVEDEPLGMRYLAAFYFAITMAAKSPWLEPSTPREFVFACFLVLACTVLYASFVGSLTAVITSYDTHLGRQREALASIRAFASHHGLKGSTQARLVREYEAYWAQVRSRLLLAPSTPPSRTAHLASFSHRPSRVPLAPSISPPSRTAHARRRPSAHPSALTVALSAGRRRPTATTRSASSWTRCRATCTRRSSRSSTRRS